MIKQKIRAIIYNRDQNKCVECGSATELSIDHIIPLSKGGTNIPENLQLLCKRCNTRKGSRINWDWVERVKMALHLDEIISRVTGELKGQISSNLSLNRSEMQTLENRAVAYMQKELAIKDKRIASLEEKLSSIEKHLKIKWVEEQVQVRGYTKPNAEQKVETWKEGVPSFMI